jgi:myo-inositol-1(or 4)-monophosphatase
MAEQEKSLFLQTAIQAALAAGDIIKENFRKIEKITFKDDMSVVTEVDIAAENKIMSIIQEQFPDHGFLAEESGATAADAEYVWIIDPLDGTTNFAMKHPFFNTAIALLHNNKPILAVVNNSIEQSLYHAELGTGGFCNDTPLSVSPETDIKRGVLTFCHSRKPEAIERAGKIYVALQKINPSIMRMGAADLELVHVAAGRTLCYFATSPKKHDFIPGAFIAQEAGAICTDFDGKPLTPESGDILVAAPGVHAELLALIDNSLS